MSEKKLDEFLKNLIIERKPGEQVNDYIVQIREAFRKAGYKKSPQTG